MLLNALDALADHRNALILVGAQAGYLRTEPLDGYQDFTTDGDLALDPGLLGDRPGLEEAMRRAGFRLLNEDTGKPEPGIWEAREPAPDRAEDFTIPVDLIVPETVAPPGGRRSARLGGQHGKRADRRAIGLEGALVDHSPVEIPALAAGDTRSTVIKVAGEAALIVQRFTRSETERPGRTGSMTRTPPTPCVSSCRRRLTRLPIVLLCFSTTIDRPASQGKRSIVSTRSSARPGASVPRWPSAPSKAHSLPAPSSRSAQRSSPTSDAASRTLALSECQSACVDVATQRLSEWALLGSNQ